MIYDFKSRFKTAFGFVAAQALSRLVSDGFGKVKNEGGSYGLEVYAMNEGTFDDVELHRNNHTESYFFAYRSITEGLTDIFATPPMLTLRRAKRLVVSVIDNTDTEVVERFATEPWEITWRGLLIDMTEHEFPIDKLKSLNELFEVNSIWNVASEILRSVNVLAVYVKDIEISFVEGYEDTIAYTLTLRSIKPLEYQLLNQN